MIFSSLLAAATGIIVLVIGQLPAHCQGVFVFAPVFLLIGAPDHDRPLYVAASNTLIGMITLWGGGLCPIVQAFKVRYLLLVLIILAIFAAGFFRFLPQARDMATG